MEVNQLLEITDVTERIQNATAGEWRGLRQGRAKSDERNRKGLRE